MHEIMTIEEVAAYLRVSERTVYDWAQKGDLPGGKLGTTWRFKRDDVENWVNARLSKSKSNVPKGKKGESILTIERVVLSDCGNKREVLTQLVDLLGTSPFVKDKEKLLAGIFAREELMSTGIGFGIAVPHVRMDSIKDLVMAVAVCNPPIKDYVSLDKTPVQIVCMLAARSDQHSNYIRALSAISSRLKDETVRSAIVASKSPTQIHDLLMGVEG